MQLVTWFTLLDQLGAQVRERVAPTAKDTALTTESAFGKTDRSSAQLELHVKADDCARTNVRTGSFTRATRSRTHEVEV